MRRVLLFRHSRAEPAADGENDQGRPLAASGREDAAKIGAYLARHDLKLDRVLVSPATRTRQTWQHASGNLRGAPDPVFEPRIYNAAAQTLLDVLKAAPSAARAVMLIGHNPGIHELALHLVATGDVDTRERLREKFPTSGLAVIDFPAAEWSALHPRGGRLERFVSPKSIGPSDY